MEARVYRQSSVIVLELRGRVEESNTRVLCDEIETIINTGRARVALDFAASDFCSARCFRGIWARACKARERGGDVVLAAARGAVLDTIHCVNLDAVVRRFVTLEEAIVYLENGTSAPFPPLGRPPEGRGLRALLGRFLLRVGLCLLFWFIGGTTASATPPPANDQSRYTLEEVLALAREASPQVKLARLRMVEKEAEVKIAKSQGLPRLVGTGGYLYQSNPNLLSEVINRELNNVRNESEDINIEQPRTRTRFQVDKDAVLVGLGFSQVVYSGGVFRNQVLLKEAQRNEADAQVAVEGLSIEEQVRNLYTGLLLVQERLKLLRARKEAILEREAALRRAHEARTINALQLAEVELQNLKSDDDILAAEREEASLRGLLNIGLGRPSDALLIPVPVTLGPAGELQTAEHYFDMALHRYPELRRSAALMDSAAAYLDITKAQSNFSPQALVFGSVEMAQGIGGLGRDFSWSLGVGVLVPLYDGHKSSAENDKATSLATQSRIAYEESARRLKIEINEVVSRLRQSQLQRQLALKAVEIASRRAAEAQGAVEQGQLPRYRQGEARTQEIEARISVIAAEAEWARWWARLLLLTGQKES